VIAAAAVGVAAVLELVVAEPPGRLHPVAWLGRAIASLDRDWHRPALVGIAAALALPLLAGCLVAGTVWLAGLITPWLAAAVAGLALFVATSLRMLLSSASATIRESDDDLDAARRSLRALAGRDASDLSPGQVRSAAVESAAENLADGLVAPLGAFVFGVLVGRAAGLTPVPLVALAAGAAAWVKAVNTMDSMLGYRSKPVGRCPARLDDVVMWLPARTSALLLALVTRDVRALVQTRSWLATVPSPNSGWPMGTLAAVHNVSLEKPGVYTLNPRNKLPSRETAESAVRTVAIAGVIANALAATVVLLVTEVIA
jgi:adenosylcobinamide-phosphate synthase